jgi:hypothetical protein
MYMRNQVCLIHEILSGALGVICRPNGDGVAATGLQDGQLLLCSVSRSAAGVV